MPDIMLPVAPTPAPAKKPIAAAESSNKDSSGARNGEQDQQDAFPSTFSNQMKSAQNTQQQKQSQSSADPEEADTVVENTQVTEQLPLQAATAMLQALQENHQGNGTVTIGNGLPGKGNALPQQSLRPIANPAVAAQLATAVDSTEADSVGLDALAVDALSGKQASASPAVIRLTPQPVAEPAPVVLQEEMLGAEKLQSVIDSALQGLRQGKAGAANGERLNVDLNQLQGVNLSLSGTSLNARPMSSGFDALSSIQSPVGKPQWGSDLGNRVLWMVSNQLQGAEFKLNPPQLGPLEIRVTVQNDQANVAFAAAHGSTKEAVEAALPRLREMLSENGLSLGNVDVSQHSFSEHKEQSEQFGQDWRSENDAEQADNLLANGSSLSIDMPSIGTGMVDFYA